MTDYSKFDKIKENLELDCSLNRTSINTTTQLEKQIDQAMLHLQTALVKTCSDYGSTLCDDSSNASSDGTCDVSAVVSSSSNE